jgi:hypothetical protein
MALEHDGMYWLGGTPHHPDYLRQQGLVPAHEVRVLRQALRELVDLKALKDAQGKTPEYERRQPKAWAAARKVLGLPGEPDDPPGDVDRELDDYLEGGT